MLGQTIYMVFIVFVKSDLLVHEAKFIFSLVGYAVRTSVGVSRDLCRVFPLCGHKRAVEIHTFDTVTLSSLH